MSGVYSAQALVDGKSIVAIVNVGNNPTVGNDKISVESHLIDFYGNLYSKEVVLNFDLFIRSEKKFASLNELQEQIAKDLLQLKECAL